jgi:hypothetical protein
MLSRLVIAKSIISLDGQVVFSLLRKEEIK